MKKSKKETWTPSTPLKVGDTVIGPGKQKRKIIQAHFAFVGGGHIWEPK